DQRAGDHVVQSLVLVGESRHDVADHQGQRGEILGKVPPGRAAEVDAVPSHVSDSEAHGHLAKRRLARGAFTRGRIEPCTAHSAKSSQKLYGKPMSDPEPPAAPIAPPTMTPMTTPMIRLPTPVTSPSIKAATNRIQKPAVWM